MYRRRPAAAGPTPVPILRAGRLALLTTSAVHLGFQSMVTSVVYPQLFDGSTHGIAERQADHARRIAPVALTLYATGLGAAAWAAYGSVRSAERSGLGATLLACATGVAVPAITAGVVPLHVGIAREQVTGPRIRALMATDRLRTGLAALGLAAAAQALSSRD
ncbi:hypothetical protein BFG51_04900 [Dietzia alimentaria]|jgi:hypothetical protein|uniref:hypothetical protein n=1 Tax=Dietzia TaxID=37914 RepID=UPI0008053AF9|nr:MULTISPECIES: hypothetical protein [Dietzia]MDJ0422023.1 hypothetical protein [Dietzia kunjamensis]OAV76457.1 hypothetical protein AYO52_08300 [Dietzia sp. 111N12-1]ODQ86652.1 hypothetical protein BFG51_04900 [Dietzia alimentaria]HBD21304.1 hypothetical protein [Dietzia sp.]